MQAEQRMRKSMWGQFWSAHQRFFKYLCIASKVKHVVKLAREGVKIGKVSNNNNNAVFIRALQKTQSALQYMHRYR